MGKCVVSDEGEGGRGKHRIDLHVSCERIEMIVRQAQKIHLWSHIILNVQAITCSSWVECSQHSSVVGILHEIQDFHWNIDILSAFDAFYFNWHNRITEIVFSCYSFAINSYTLKALHIKTEKWINIIALNEHHLKLHLFSLKRKSFVWESHLTQTIMSRQWAMSEWKVRHAGK